MASFNSSTCSSGKYTVTVQPPQVKEPFNVTTEVHSGTETPPITWNFKDILEKQNPEAAAQIKKQEEEKSKFNAMKQHFDQGMALLEQERTAKADLSKAPADQSDAAKAKVADLRDSGRRSIPGSAKGRSGKRSQRPSVLGAHG